MEGVSRGYGYRTPQVPCRNRVSFRGTFRVKGHQDSTTPRSLCRDCRYGNRTYFMFLETMGCGRPLSSKYPVQENTHFFTKRSESGVGDCGGCEHVLATGEGVFHVPPDRSGVHFTFRLDLSERPGVIWWVPLCQSSGMVISVLRSVTDSLLGVVTDLCIVLTPCSPYPRLLLTCL